MKKKKIIFAGTNKLSAEHLNQLIIKKFNIISIITKLDNKIRNKNIFSEVKKIAIQNKIEFIQPKSLNSKKIYQYIKNIKPHIMIVVSYGLIIPKKIINLFPLGCINVHTSLLPKLRGPSPIQYTILQGIKKTGITIIEINEKIDSGYILYKKSIIIKKNETYITLLKKLSILGKKSLIKCLKKIFLKKIIKIPQNEKKVTYTNKIKKKNGLINWHSNAKNIEKQIRAFILWPGSFFFIKKIMIKIWKAKIVKSSKKNIPGTILKANKNGIFISTKKNILKIKKLQISGKKKNNVSQIINSYKKLFKIGKILN
ncbi:MAG: methionyl-tRNA formyltransferase [Buchnera aphidicola (Periphyllus acericola)]|uniref:methionyl-tRNA formyltransferase n=1 Tax=Buchnera aphidicola TaxID=9 RepID=UPI0030D524F4|nr:methionyl-tRNA formyltransferase [Buchnera aphidicola (Periphyllus acericola)]